jgi:hypothetical protein
MWHCRCQCGNERIICSGHLRSGHNKSCGCWKIDKQRSKHPQEAQKHAAWLGCRQGATRRGYEFSLTNQQWLALTQQPCFYCGIVKSNEKKADPRNQWGESFWYNGIDRINNEKGYTFENSVSCCSTCNFMKWKLDAPLFVEHCRRIASWSTL